ncbi:ATP-binding cassette domain-containing protein [Brevibacillus laterosporus]|uniref:ABC transporter ATP-binding protein n=2 Tax=Brevibacillus TaxID=55080 RepID=A0A0F7EEF6_BRELA|nr:MULTISPECIES: ATP-binding cassette domain-containing protein [Brevibacillus]AKF92403.1 ABC transporter ATP-binding protein [Brevibacillus laterosporus]MCR8984495.1 ATP-binding cassette domain-containing protein [Brevibacillus laterosporus]MCZ0830220.1 ATP-binding cassette domain-containing protein [Brevibacillus halotolerans]
MAIHFHEVTYSYQLGDLFQETALDNIHVGFPSGSFTAIIGPSGCGKSTLLQHMNGILLPTKGHVHILDHVITPHHSKKGIRQLRQRVGLIFQFPEHQMFADSVEKEIVFGPKNYGASPSQARALAIQALHQVNLGVELLDKNPFQLSGGQMRKVAIASILAMNPDILVLDEPTATLDCKSRHELLQLLHHLCKQEHKTVIMVTHRLEEVLSYCDRVVIMQEGKVAFQGETHELREQTDILATLGITIPAQFRFQHAFRQRFPELPLPTDQSVQGWARYLGERKMLLKEDKKQQAGDPSC